MILHKVEKITPDLFKIIYKRTIKSLAGDDVVIKADVFEKTKTEITDEILRCQSEIISLNQRITRLQAELDAIISLG